MLALSRHSISAAPVPAQYCCPRHPPCRLHTSISARTPSRDSSGAQELRGMSSARQRSKPVVRLSGTSTPDTVAPSTSTGHAWLHDFCVSIPYGAAMAALTLIAWFQQQASFATILLGASIGSLSFTYLSLQNWKANKDCKPYTLLTAGAAALGAVFSYQRSALVSPWLAWPAAVISAGVAMFLIYNVLAGGNPPQGEKPLADAAPHSVD